MDQGSLFSLPCVIVGGKRRLLGCKQPHANFGSLPKFAAANPIVRRSQWKPINRRSQFPASSWILDQGEIGSCVANASAAALRKIRTLEGQTEEIALSPGCLYAQINGGRDAGAVISDALTALQLTGTCSYQTVGETPYLTDQMPLNWQVEAKRFRISLAYHCQTFDEIGTALQYGFLVVYGIRVGDSFQLFDNYGVAGASAGPGNHCMHADGMAILSNGQWALDNCNSWGASWGPWQNGRCYLVEEHFLDGDQPDAYAIMAATGDPLEPNNPPVLAA